MSAFEELGICPEIIHAVAEDDWLLPTPVQQEAIPLILGGGDVLVAAETGSGKTGAFGLPCLQLVQETLRGRCGTKRQAASNIRCELSLVDKDMFILVTEDGLECKSDDDKRWNGIRATVEVMQGRYMFEVEIVEGLVCLGWSASFTSLELGSEERSFGYCSTGQKVSAFFLEDYGEEFEPGDVIGCLLDRGAQTISFAKNQRNLGVAFKLSPEMRHIGLKPHICGKGFLAAAKFDAPLECAVEGYTPIGEIDPGHTPGGAAQARGKRPPLCLVLEPTRDLAEQTYKWFTKFNKNLVNPTIRCALLVGGLDEKEQFRALEEGVDVCVGTLPRTMDYIKRGKLDVSQVKFLILDEADDLQAHDARKDIPRLNAQIKRGRRDRVQTMFFSATLHTEQVQNLIAEVTTRPVWVDLKGQDSVPETVHHVALYIDPTGDFPLSDAEVAVRAQPQDRSQQPKSDGVHDQPSMSPTDRAFPDALVHSEKIKTMKPKYMVKMADLFNMSQCLVFCRTNVDCNNLEDYLNRLGGGKKFDGKTESGKENPYSCVVLAGMRNQDERRSNLQAFKEGDVRFLICTDVAARGIDIEGLPYVIQTTLPDNTENYIHRIGRCGRAQRMGLAISVVAAEKEKVWYHKCPSGGRACEPAPGNTCLTIPYGPDKQLKAEDLDNWIVDEGGCTIWYDEMQLVREVEKRIGMPMKVMDPSDFSVPGLLESPLPADQRQQVTEVRGPEEPTSRRARKRQEELSVTIAYGAKKGDLSSKASAKFAAAMRPAVAELESLEQSIQQSYAEVLWRFGTAASSDDAAAGLGGHDGQSQDGLRDAGDGFGAPPPAAAKAAACAEESDSDVSGTGSDCSASHGTDSESACGDLDALAPGRRW